MVRQSKCLDHNEALHHSHPHFICLQVKQEFLWKKRKRNCWSPRVAFTISRHHCWCELLLSLPDSIYESMLAGDGERMGLKEHTLYMCTSYLLAMRICFRNCLKCKFDSDGMIGIGCPLLPLLATHLSLPLNFVAEDSHFHYLVYFLL